MNETIRTLETRRSVRGFDPERMPSDEVIKEIVEAGEYAPTGRGMQSPRIVVVTNKAVRDRLSELNAEVMGTTSDPFYGAPVVLIVLADRQRPTYMYDAQPHERRPFAWCGKLLDTQSQRGVRHGRGQGDAPQVGHRRRL